MNQIFLFIGGILLGILLSLTLVNRFQDKKSDLHSNIDRELEKELLLLHHLRPTTDEHNPITTSKTPLQQLQPISPPIQPSLPIQPLIPEPQEQKTVSSQPDNIQLKTSEINTPIDTFPKSTNKKPKIRWSPGRDSNLDHLKQLANSAQNEFISEETESKESPGGIEGSPEDSSAGRRKEKRGTFQRQKRGGNRKKTFLQQEGLSTEESTAAGGQNSAALLRKRKREEQRLQKQLNQEKKNYHQQLIGNQVFDEDPESTIKIEPEPIPATTPTSTSTAASTSTSVSTYVARQHLDPEGVSRFGVYHAQAMRGNPRNDVITLELLKTSTVGGTVVSQKTRKSYKIQEGFDPFIPTYSYAQQNLKQSIPDMSLQKGEHEKENLKLHHCNGVFEAYSASYLTTKTHMLAVESEGFNLSWVNCEMASFIHMKESNKFFKDPDVHGMIWQSLDVLDFSVIHLSAYERSTHKHRDALFKSKQEMLSQWHNIDPVIKAGEKLNNLNNPKAPNSRKLTYLREAVRTVVIMPFLGGVMGAGHSKLNNRFEYLKTCFWSIYEFFPNIVAAVTRQEDVDWGWNESGLPFYDLILIENLPKSASLPVATTQQTKKRLQDGRWDFDYVFFTESDQILISRELPMLFKHLQKYPGHMILPHRLMPYSDRVISEVHKKELKSMPENKWMEQSCCIQRQNCQDRKTWLYLKEPAVSVINYYGLYVPLGNVNFLAETYRSCKISDYIGDYCP